MLTKQRDETLKINFRPVSRNVTHGNTGWNVNEDLPVTTTSYSVGNQPRMPTKIHPGSLETVGLVDCLLIGRSMLLTAVSFCFGWADAASTYASSAFQNRETICYIRDTCRCFRSTY